MSIDVTALEGYYYFINNLKEIGVIESDDSDILAAHTLLTWEVYKDTVLERVGLRSVVSHFKHLTTTNMRDGRFNHVFKVVI
jgi:hypothetical protein